MAKPKDSFVIYARGKRTGDDSSRVHVVILPTVELARSWVQCFIGEDYFYPVLNELEYGNFKLKCSRMNEILEYGVSTAELEDYYRKWMLQFKYGAWEKSREPVVASTEAPQAPKPERIAKAQRPPGYVSITELCAAWNVPALHARTMLRASGRVKPEYGWMFDPKETDALKKLVGISG